MGKGAPIASPIWLELPARRIDGFPAIRTDPSFGFCYPTRAGVHVGTSCYNALEMCVITEAIAERRDSE